MTRAELEAKIEALEELRPMYKRTACIHGGHENAFLSVPDFWIQSQIDGFRAQLAALPEEPADGTHKLFVWTDHCTFAAVAHAKTVAQARELIESEDLGGADGSCPERAAARKMIYGETPGIYRGAQAVLMFDTGKADELKPWTARERRLLGHIKGALNTLGTGRCLCKSCNSCDFERREAVEILKISLTDTPPPNPRDEALEKAEKWLLDLWRDFPPKIDPRLKYREVQFSDSEVAEVCELIAAIRAAREGR